MALTFITPSSDSFWSSLELFPKGIEQLGKLSTATEDAVSILNGLGRGNLRAIAEHARIPIPGDLEGKSLPAVLVRSSDPATIVLLKEFLRRRTDGVEAAFGRALGRKARGLDESVRTLSFNGRETVKPFTKLILLYRDNPQHLNAVHSHSIWQSQPTSFEFEADRPLSPQANRKIVSRQEQIAAALSKAIGSRPVQFIGSYVCPDGMMLYSFFREYTGRVHNDFRDGFLVHHGCGRILFGVSRNRKHVFVKGGNRDIAVAIQTIISETFDVTLTLLQDQWFSEYTVEAFRDKILGGYSAQAGIEIVGAEFCRSGFGSHGPLTIGTPFLASSIKAELEFIQEHGLVEINSPKDIASLSLSFKGCPVVVRTLCEANGALRLSCDSTQLGTEELGEFRAAFSAVFGVPLDRRLHPGRFALGTMGIYEWLFGLSSERESEAIHKEFLDDLIDRRFLVRHTVEAKACCNNLCKRRGTPIEDKSRVVCPKCEQELHEVHFERLEPRTDSIAQFMGEVFQDADDWELAPEMRILDGHEYYELRRHAGTGQEESVCMVIADRPSRELLRVFGSTGLPLLLVKTRDEGRRMRIDDDCSLHVNLSYVLSAQEAQSAKDECREECRSYLTRLLHTHEERVLKAARSSHECISALRRSMTGDEYERHISNLLRRLFPYTYNLGRKGKVEPDGYVCLPHYETSSIEHVGSWNFSYDAKYSAQTNGYDFDIDEARKVITYITKMRRSRRSLFGGNNRARAHVLISNNLSEVKLKRAAQHIFGPDGIAANDSDIRLVLMLQEFLVALYEFVSDRNSELSRRRPVFYDVVIRLFQTAQVGGYLILERSHA